MTALDIEDPAALRSYLESAGRIAPGEAPRIEILRGGVSNRTVKVARANGESWVLKQSLARLRVAVDWFSPPERIAREAEAIRILGAILPDGAVPSLVFFDAANNLLAMSAVPEPHANWKNGLLAGRVDSAIVRQFATTLAAIHTAAISTSPPEFLDRSIFESLRLEPYYEYTATQVPEAAAFLCELIRDTRLVQSAIVHGDYSPKNVLVRGGQMVLLDHEVIHIGDPAFDLGFSLTHLLSKAHHLPEHRRLFEGAAREYWSVYREAATPDRELEARAVRHTLGCLLARVAGRSPLEYLSEAERRAQRAVTAGIMNDPPAQIPGLIGEFLGRIASCR